MLRENEEHDVANMGQRLTGGGRNPQVDKLQRRKYLNQIRNTYSLSLRPRFPLFGSRDNGIDASMTSDTDEFEYYLKTHAMFLLRHWYKDLI